MSYIVERLDWLVKDIADWLEYEASWKLYTAVSLVFFMLYSANETSSAALSYEFQALFAPLALIVMVMAAAAAVFKKDDFGLCMVGMICLLLAMLSPEVARFPGLEVPTLWAVLFGAAAGYFGASHQFYFKFYDDDASDKAFRLMVTVILTAASTTALFFDYDGHAVLFTAAVSGALAVFWYRLKRLGAENFLSPSSSNPHSGTGLFDYEERGHPLT